MRERALFVIWVLIVGTFGCSSSGGTTAAPTQSRVEDVGTIVAATMQALTIVAGESIPTQTATEAPTQVNGTSVSYENVSFVFPNGLAENASPETITAVDPGSGAPWDAAPTHIRFTLTGYLLQGKFHEPGIYVYPADEYARVNSIAAVQIESIRKIRAGGDILRETMPRVPWFNADLMIVANNKIIQLQNGMGIRTLTEYAQYYAPINNNELIYHFQGLSEDDRYYIFAILPVTAPILPENEKPEAPVPDGGVPFPTDTGQVLNYYISVTGKLNSLAPDSYTPSLETLDALIESVHVTTP